MTYEIEVKMQVIVEAKSEAEATALAWNLAHEARSFGRPLAISESILWHGALDTRCIAPVTAEEFAELGG